MISGPIVERLERRTHLSATVTLNNKGRIIITGDDNPTDVLITISQNKKTIQVLIDGVIVDPKPNAGKPDSVKRDQVKRFAITMGAGNDRVQVGVGDNTATPEFEKNKLTVRAVIDGGAGDDYIQGGAANDVLIGNAGNDVIFGDRNVDLLLGGTGDDQLLGAQGRDNIFGQDGNDRLNGGPGNDTLYGMDGSDSLAGAGDDDFLNGKPGPDTREDRNEEPDAGEREDVDDYLSLIIRLGVPEPFRDAARG